MFLAVLAVVGLLGVAVIGVGYVAIRKGWIGPQPSPTALAQRRPTVQPLRLPSAVGAGELLTVSTVAFADDDPAQAWLPARVTLAIAVPPGAAEMQVGLETSIGTSPWVDVAPSAVLSVNDVGYQQAMVRFRSADNRWLAERGIVGFEIDPMRDLAAASLDDLHRVAAVRVHGPDQLIVRIEEGRSERGALVAYDLNNPEPGDDVKGWEFLNQRKTVVRDGEVYGFEVSDRTDVLRLTDRFVGRLLDVARLENESWTLEVDGVATGVQIGRRYSRPTGGGDDGDDGGVGGFFHPSVHEFFLQLSEPLRDGAVYRLVPPAELVESVDFRFDRLSTLSDSVHVNQAGYAPADAKTAYVSTRPGVDGVDVSGARFEVVQVGADGSSRVRVLTGSVPDPVEEPVDKDGRPLVGAPVHRIDFTSLSAPGRYQVCVEGLGCSLPFEVDGEVWDELVVAIGRAAYHQRSGVELGPPYTAVRRPRPYHPEDGATVVGTDVTLADAQRSGENNFGVIAARGRDDLISEAWGGHFDAGDWDRRIQHLWFVRAAAELVTEYPDQFADTDLSIPESGDAVPDLLDEALWSLDLFKRMQTEAGAIRGGIEASEHPPENATSWTDDLAAFAFEPDPWSSYVYAGVAAEMAATLEPYDRDRAADYLVSAREAFEWAEAQPPLGGLEEETAAQRTVAAAAFLYSTGEERWASIVAADVAAAQPGLLACHEHTLCDTAWLSIKASQRFAGVIDEALVERLTQDFVTTADAVMARADANGYLFTVDHPGVPLIWGLGLGGAPKATALARAYALTGDRAYRDAIANSAGVSLGANPLNQSYVTGVGSDAPDHPLIIDFYNGGLPVWAGTPVYGNHQLNTINNDQWAIDFVLDPAGVWPEAQVLPYLWQWYDIDGLAFFNEFTMHQSHGPALLAYGTLAATSG